MKSGRVRDGLPRVTVNLPGRTGAFPIEFVLDTGFDGGLTLPQNLAEELAVEEPEVRLVRLAGGYLQRCRYYEVSMESEDGEDTTVEVLVMDGNPLMGCSFLTGQLVSIEMVEGGTVSAEVM